MRLLSVGTNAKTIKSDKSGLGYSTAIMYLSPYKLSGHNVCPSATVGCIKGCLNTAGRGKMNMVQLARMNRAKLFFEDRETFKDMLIREIKTHCCRCIKNDVRPAIRLNGTSDLPWEQLFPSIFTQFDWVKFYDYTKVTKRAIAFAKGDLPSNYHITYSRNEENEAKCKKVLDMGVNVAAVWRTQAYPTSFLGYPVNNADSHDLRFLDPWGIQALYAKGKAKHDKTGFVLDMAC